MKRKSEFERERDAALLRAYREVLRQVDYIRLDEVCAKVSASPSPRFWVSEERAAEVVGRMMRGGKVDCKKPMRRAMFEEIYRRCMRELRKGYDFKDAIFRVVNSPAPSFYYEPKSVKIILWRIKQKRK